MTAEEFAVWAEARPEKNWELLDGEPILQQSQNWGHANLKGLIYAALLRETRAHAPNHFAAVDGLVMKVDGNTAFEPDVVVYAGPRMQRGEIVVPKPVIAVEVLSQSTARKDLTDKLAGYFRAPSILHYVIADPDSQELVYYRRQDEGIAPPAILKNGVLRLDPPGIAIELAEIFE
jgi:Uma2 family endonuclease